MREGFFRGQVRRVANFSNRQWGEVSGLDIGFAKGIYCLANFQDELQISDTFLKIFIEATGIPLSSGALALVFGAAGAGVDDITNNETIVSVIYNKYSVYEDARAFFLRLRHADSSSHSSDMTLDSMEAQPIEVATAAQGAQPPAPAVVQNSDSDSSSYVSDGANDGCSSSVDTEEFRARCSQATEWAKERQKETPKSSWFYMGSSEEDAEQAEKKPLIPRLKLGGK